MGEFKSHNYSELNNEVDSEKYVDKNSPDYISSLEKTLAFRMAEQRLEKPFEEIKYKEKGDVNISKGPFNLEYSYSDCKLEQFIINIDHYKNIYDKENGISDNEYREVTELTFSRNDKEKTSFNLKEIVPEGYHVFFRTSENINCPIPDGSIDPSTKTIMLERDIASPYGLMTLLHEIGHAKDFENLSEKEKTLFLEVGDNFDKKSVIHNALLIKIEKNAIAFALSKIKPFSDNDYGDNKTNILREDIKSFARGLSCDYANQAWNNLGKPLEFKKNG